MRELEGKRENKVWCGRNGDIRPICRQNLRQKKKELVAFIVLAIAPDLGAVVIVMLIVAQHGASGNG